ncbi:hypothetical protein IE53DRAFT_390202 [Violaceomyces palustris]|uniref:Uncharacterized protein n=1 Tax=Violaceomyces palustris TaxID=1673888 RepID=A0ACD0NPD5_9BASI|nr:hypothetical protein IE53DRAFT_390202 [Violaceomyces palustris]
MGEPQNQSPAKLDQEQEVVPSIDSEPAPLTLSSTPPSSDPPHASGPPVDPSFPSTAEDSSKEQQQQRASSPPPPPPPTQPKRGAAPKQYLNPTRHLTGGPTREKLSPEQLAERMEKAKIQNEAILKRRELVERDKDCYSEITEREKEERREKARKAVEDKKIQLAIDEERSKNRARKLEKAERRDWDSEKSGRDALWQTNYKEYSRGGGGGRGGGGYGRDFGRGTGRYEGGGRGRGRGVGGGRGGIGHAQPGNDGGKRQVRERVVIDTSSKEEFPSLGQATLSKPAVSMARTTTDPEST